MLPFGGKFKIYNMLSSVALSALLLHFSAIFDFEVHLRLINRARRARRGGSEGPLFYCFLGGEKENLTLRKGKLNNDFHCASKMEEDVSKLLVLISNLLFSVLNLPPDVAGATLMAAGSSGPELATAVIGVFVAKVLACLRTFVN